MKNFSFQFFLISILGFNTSGCSYFIKSKPSSERVAAFEKIDLKTNQPVEVLWTKNLVPRIKAQNSRDLFYTLGAVQMHLRHTQLEIYRKISRGALSEMAGPVSLKLDKLIRTIDFDRAAEISLKSMSQESLQVLEALSEGMNDYLEQSDSLPLDAKIMGLKKTPWTVKDLVRVYKFSSIDVNWTVFLQLLEFENLDFVQKVYKLKTEEKDFFDWFLKDLKNKPIDKSSEKKIENSDQTDVYKTSQNVKLENKTFFSYVRGKFSFQKIQDSFLKYALDQVPNYFESGSNAFALGANKTKNRSGLLSSDPHLGLVIPNIWLFVVLECPEFQSMGYLIPSFPVPVIGRNSSIAWGGTNLWGLSTFPTELTKEQSLDVTPVEHTLKVRFWKDQKVKTYRLNSQSVLKSSDFPLIGNKDLVINWQGYKPSNEVETFLKVNKATNFNQFHKAFESYSVAGMTFIYSDTEGHVGKITALNQEQVKKVKPIYQTNDFLSKSLNSFELPSQFNPDTNYVVSANDYTAGLRQPLSLFQAPNDRKNRMTFLLEDIESGTVQDVQEIQKDVFSATAFELKNELIKFIADKDWITPSKRELFNNLELWNGNYDSNSQGALVFEVFMAIWSEDILSQMVLKDLKFKNIEKVSEFLVKFFDYRTFLSRSLVETDFMTEAKFNLYLNKTEFVFNKYKNWGNFHKLDLRHPLGNLILFKWLFSFENTAWPGGNETLMKAAHKLSSKTAKVNFGAQARWITDLSNINENYFVYLGGQDGYIGSKNINDLSGLWKKGSYLKVPFERSEFLKISINKGQ